MTSDNRPTPGPWFTNGAEILWRPREDGPGILVARVAGDTGESRANANLMAASHDLFASLLALLPEIDAEIEQRQHGGNDEDWKALEALSDAAHKAIRKARPVGAATNRPGDAAAIYAEETGVDYSTALARCNMD